MQLITPVTMYFSAAIAMICTHDPATPPVVLPFMLIKSSFAPAVNPAMARLPIAQLLHLVLLDLVIELWFMDLAQLVFYALQWLNWQAQRLH